MMREEAKKRRKRSSMSEWALWPRDTSLQPEPRLSLSSTSVETVEEALFFDADLCFNSVWLFFRDVWKDDLIFFYFFGNFIPSLKCSDTRVLSSFILCLSVSLLKRIRFGKSVFFAFFLALAARSPLKNDFVVRFCLRVKIIESLWFHSF